MNHEPPPEHEPESEPDAIAVEVSDTQSHLKLDPGALTALVRDTLRAEQVGRASVSLAVVDDATIRVVNRRHLDHDWPTDVISFLLSEPGDSELSGELVVSAETAVGTARRAGVAPWPELALYVVHGLLHLCGYDDTEAGDRAAMRRREEEILARLGLSNAFHAADGFGLVGAGPDAGVAGRESARWTG